MNIEGDFSRFWVGLWIEGECLEKLYSRCECDYVVYADGVNVPKL